MATTYKVLGTIQTLSHDCAQRCIPALPQHKRLSQPSQSVIRLVLQEHTELLCVQMEQQSQQNIILSMMRVIQANTTAAYTLGITIDASDVVTVYASSANLSFNAFGSEIA
jgi:hypothetical protein